MSDETAKTRDWLSTRKCEHVSHDVTKTQVPAVALVQFSTGALYMWCANHSEAAARMGASLTFFKGIR